MEKNVYRAVLLALVVTFTTSLKAQLAYSPFTDSLSNLATEERLMLLLRQLAGDTTFTLNNQVQQIDSRHYQHPDNQLATNFIESLFIEYGYEPVIQNFNQGRGQNVIATKTGTLYPDKQYIICAHYDNMPSGSTAPGADDNASGTVAVLEAARILRNIDLAYTVKFIAWDEEEIGLIGSQYYANIAAANNDQILGVINLDMIAWDSNDDFVYSIATNTLSKTLTEEYVTTTGYYQPQLSNNLINTTASDHSSFWQKGYPALLAIEDDNDFHEYYHTIWDNISNINVPYFVAMSRAAIAGIVAQALDQRITFQHTPVVSGNSTQPRETYVVIESSHNINVTNYQPRLYYTTDSVTFYNVEAHTVSADTFFFTLPGFPIGTNISYYFAAQDDAGTMSATYPVGGMGINPPGTEGPESYFRYKVANIVSEQFCSLNTPLTITNNSTTSDYIVIEENGTIEDIEATFDIVHSATQELRLILAAPDNTGVLLVDRGTTSGPNFTQTTFDEQAAMNIDQGQSPYTGRFRPKFSFEPFAGKEIKGEWKLRISESGPQPAGTLNSWCIHFLFNDLSVSVVNKDIYGKEILMQNYPNPARTSTNIKFHLSSGSNIQLYVSDNTGQRIRNLAQGNYQQGTHLLVVSTSDLKPGTYFYTLQTDQSTVTRQLVVVR